MESSCRPKTSDITPRTHSACVCARARREMGGRGGRAGGRAGGQMCCSRRVRKTNGETKHIH